MASQAPLAVSSQAGPSDDNYTSAYTDIVYDKNGAFWHFSCTPNDMHREEGYWKFTTDEDMRRAYRSGFYTPEKLLLAVDSHYGTYEDINLRWMPGKNGPQFMGQMEGNAGYHLRVIYDIKKFLGGPVSFRGKTPRYPTSSSMEDYWRLTIPQESAHPSMTPPQETAHLSSMTPQPESSDHSLTMPQEDAGPSLATLQEHVYPSSMALGELEDLSSMTPQESAQSLSTTPQPESLLPLLTMPQDAGPALATLQEHTYPSSVTLEELEHPSSTTLRELTDPPSMPPHEPLDASSTPGQEFVALPNSESSSSTIRGASSPVPVSEAPTRLHEAQYGSQVVHSDEFTHRADPNIAASSEVPSETELPPIPSLSPSQSGSIIERHNVQGALRPTIPMVEIGSNPIQASSSTYRLQSWVNEMQRAQINVNPLQILAMALHLQPQAQALSHNDLNPSGFDLSLLAGNTALTHSQMNTESSAHSRSSEANDQTSSRAPFSTRNISQQLNEQRPSIGPSTVSYPASTEHSPASNSSDSTIHPTTSSAVARDTLPELGTAEQLSRGVTRVRETESPVDQGDEAKLSPAQPPSAPATFDPYPGLACMDCGEESGHTHQCHIASKLTQSHDIQTTAKHIADFLPSRPPNVLELRILADSTEFFDPGPWTTHQGPPPEPTPEDRAEEIRAMAEIVRNEPSYRNNPALHSLPDGLMVTFWALTTSSEEIYPATGPSNNIDDETEQLLW
jgi:hypothetical protein